MTQLALIATQEPATALSEVMHPFDRYDLFEELEAIGRKASWEKVLAFETVGEVLDWAGRGE